MPKPWERQPGESAKAFAAFEIYRSLPARRRSAFAVSERLGLKVAEARRGRRQAPTIVNRWRRRHEWVARASAWDREKARRQRVAEARNQRQMAKRHAQDAVAFQRKILERLATLSADELTPAALIRWYESAVKIERLSRGAPPPTTTVAETRRRRHDHEIARAILEDPEACDWACRVLDRVAIGSAQPRGAGVVGDAGTMEAGASPRDD